MSLHQHGRAMVRLALLGVTVTGMAACADQVAAPQRRALRPSDTAQRDDPPNVYCPSGWQDFQGIWVCPP